ncbi:kinase-like protein, partial [Cucurbitaria berberidis CBS 394.84]
MVLSTAETLSQALADAIRRTREPRSDRFLPKADLDQILCHDSLIALYQKLFRIVVPQREPNDMLTSNPWIDNPSHDVIGYAQKTVKNPSRISLLALFLLDQREELLSLFKDWLSSDDAKFPSDEDLPLSADGRWLPGIGFHHWEYILEKQWIFLPFTITEQYYERVPRMCRKPFIGNPKEIKRGASGTVYKVKVAAGYWRDKKNDEYRTFSMDQLVAMKVFEDDKDYETERDFLQELRQNVSIHKRIVLDLGGLIYEDSEGKLCHSLFFELAICNLDEFLNKGDNRRFYASNGSVIAKAVDIVEALDFLHKKVRFLHLDLKPDNILIYESAEPGINDGRIWKLTDFNLAKRKIKVRSSSRERLELSNSDSTASTVPAGRGPALYQAPEIQVPGTSLASDESEVWSMGGILLVVLGFLYNPYSGAKRFRDSATVTFKDQGGERRSLYVTSKMHQW